MHRQFVRSCLISVHLVDLIENVELLLVLFVILGCIQGKHFDAPDVVEFKSELLAVDLERNGQLRGLLLGQLRDVASGKALAKLILHERHILVALPDLHHDVLVGIVDVGLHREHGPLRTPKLAVHVLAKVVGLLLYFVHHLVLRPADDLLRDGLHLLVDQVFCKSEVDQRHAVRLQLLRQGLFWLRLGGRPLLTVEYLREFPHEVLVVCPVDYA